MFSAALDGLALLADPVVIAAALAGVVFCQLVVMIPGLGGAFALVMVLPFAFRLDPTAGIALIIANAVTSGTGNSVTSILFGVPGSSTGVATVFDGYPMTQRGEAGRALGAALTASALGGLVAAVAMVLMLPIVRPLVLQFGPPEFFALMLCALFFISFLGETTLIRSLTSAGLGMMLGFIGLEPSSAGQRYTFGQVYLWDGLPLVPVMIGLFAIAEMLRLGDLRGGSIAQSGSAPASSGVRRGIADAFRHWNATLQSSIVGLLVGLIPGLGGSAAQFLAYAHVARISPNRDQFGKGAVEGLIAADAATNSKDGGTLTTALAFGIPGSTDAAILLGAFVVFGIRPGPEMLTTDLDITWMIIWTLVFANLVATGLVLSVSGWLARITFVRTSLIVAPILVVSLIGAYTTSNEAADVIVALLAGVLGLFMKRYGYSRAAFVIAFVLAPLLERNFLLSVRIHGAGFVTRPITAILLLLLAGSVLWAVRGAVLDARRRAAGAA